MNEEIESAILAGNRVHFVYLDPKRDTAKEFEFNAREVQGSGLVF